MYAASKSPAPKPSASGPAASGPSDAAASGPAAFPAGDDAGFDADLGVLLEQILVRSSIDLEFRRQLLTDPKAAIEAHLGRKLSGSFNVCFIENTADATIVLPDVRADVSPRS